MTVVTKAHDHRECPGEVSTPHMRHDHPHQHGFRRTLCLTAGGNMRTYNRPQKKKPNTVLRVTCRHKNDQKSEAKKSAHTGN